MSPEEKAKADEIYKAIIGKERNTLVKRYGKDAEKVAKGRAVKQAQKLAEKKMDPSKDKLREMVKNALMNEKAGFTDEFDNDPALKGGQKNLPDGLQKAIISKAKGKVGEDLDLGHEDNEPHMLKKDLYHIGKYAMELYQMVDQFEGMGEVDFPHWWQSKVIKAKEMMSSAKHYLDFETREPEIDAMVGIASAEDMIGEESSKEFWVVEKPNGQTVKYFGSAGEAKAWISKNDPEGMVDYNLRQVEESIDEKKLTKPELKKREEIAKAMEKGDPKMDMEKKMAIATSIAKRVAEKLMAKK